LMAETLAKSPLREILILLPSETSYDRENINMRVNDAA
jgi:hypothetical protein